MIKKAGAVGMANGCVGRIVALLMVLACGVALHSPAMATEGWQLPFNPENRGELLQPAAVPLPEGYLKAPNVEANDQFGVSVAISGDTLVVGAVGEDGDGSDPSDNSINASGAVYVFVRDGLGNWSEQAYLKASNAGLDDLFGTSVAIFGDTLVVGAPFERSNGTGPADDSALNAGAAYVFVRDGLGNWSEQAYLKAPDVDASDGFGFAVGISGDTVVVGAVGEDGDGSDPSDDSIVDSGAAYVFVRDGVGNWSPQGYLKASNVGGDDHFGVSVAVDGDTVVVGARDEDSDGSGPLDDSAAGAGAAYVFVRDGLGMWSEQAYLKAANADGGDQFGGAVAIAGDTVVVGAEGESSDGSDPADDSAGAAGAAYVFVRDGLGNWSEQGYLKASNTGAGDSFGAAVAVSGDTVIVGAYQEDGNGSAPMDNSANQAGAAYVFMRDGLGTWSEQAYLKPLIVGSPDAFGAAVGIDSQAVVVGAPLEAGDGSGPSNNDAAGAVAAYAFEIRFTVGGTLSGLAPGASVTLQNNAGDDLMLTGNGPFTFATPLANGSPYAVTVSASPSGPSQTCTVTNDSGTVDGADVSDVVVNCVTDSFTVGGTVTGLAGTGLVLQNNGGDDLPIAADGSFTFATALVDGSAYAVTVLAQPADPSQTCAVTNHSGTLNGANVTDVVVTCSTDSFTIGGTVTGLAGTGLVLQNNGGDDLPVAADGSFTFATALVDGSAYAVTVLAQPSGLSQTCAVTDGSGAVNGADVTDVVVTCVTDAFTVGGTVSGLTGTGLVLRNNGGDDLPIAADGPFTFATALADGSAYLVTVATAPTEPDQRCTITGGGGVLAGADVTDVGVVCGPLSAIPTLGRMGMVLLVLSLTIIAGTVGIRHRP